MMELCAPGQQETNDEIDFVKFLWIALKKKFDRMNEQGLEYGTCDGPLSLLEKVKITFKILLSDKGRKGLVMEQSSRNFGAMVLNEALSYSKPVSWREIEYVFTKGVSELNLDPHLIRAGFYSRAKELGIDLDSNF